MATEFLGGEGKEIRSLGFSKMKREQNGESNAKASKISYQERNNLYFSPNIPTLIKSRNMTWTGRVARMMEITNQGNNLV